MTFISFGFFLLLFIGIGILSTIKNKHTVSDYLLASNSEKPWLIALSTVATNNSGYMFIGMIGYAYVNGLSAMWIMICAIFGDFCASLFVHKKLRIATGKSHSLSFPEALSKWNGTNYPVVRVISALIIVVFLSIYAAAQLSAGGKAMHALFGWNYAIGSTIGAVIVLGYCLAGGIRASIWTNTAQSFVMIASMGLLFFMSLNKIGGFDNFISQLQNVSPQYFSIYPQDLFFNQGLGLAFFIFGWFFGGFGIIGQPHIMSSFMAMDKVQNLNRIRLYYYSWYIGFYVLTIATGLAARLLIPMQLGFDSELALPTLSQQVLPDILIGLILAGLFSSTMSAADSQILGCSAAIINDLLPKKNNTYFMAKSATLFVTVFATIIAIDENKSVFALANIGWLALACSFAPMMTIYAFGGKMSQRLTLITMLTGFGVMMTWRHLGFGSALYEAGPGIIAGTFPYLLHKFYNYLKPNK
jgi:sodium/proline symporter